MDVTVTRVARRRVPGGHRHGVGARTTWAGCAARPGAAGSTRCGSRTSPAAWACFGLWGPRARDVLAPLTPADLSNADVPVPDHAGDDRRRRAGARAAGDLRRRARLGAVLPDRVRRRAVARRWSTPGAAGLRPAGYRAIESLRLEKGYRVWGADIGPGHDAGRGGPGVRGASGDGFAGAAALAAAARASGVARRLRCLVLDDPRAVALGGEPVRRTAPPTSSGT